MGRNRRILRDHGETVAFGRELGEALPPNTIIALFGELGAGKTTLVKGIVEGRSGISAEEVVSPTFVYLNIYDRVFHFDLYRLHDPDEFLSLGFEEYFDAGGVCCIEWSERIALILPDRTIKIELSYLGKESREVIYEIPECKICENGL